MPARGMKLQWGCHEWGLDRRATPSPYSPTACACARLLLRIGSVRRRRKLGAWIVTFVVPYRPGHVQARLQADAGVRLPQASIKRCSPRPWRSMRRWRGGGCGMNIGVDTLTDHPRCQLKGSRIVPQPVAPVATLGEAPPMLSASIQRLRYGRLQDTGAAHRANQGVRCSPCRRGDRRADSAKCAGCVRDGLIGLDAGRIRLPAYFPVASFGAGSCAAPKHRNSVWARANTVDEIFGGTENSGPNRPRAAAGVSRGGRVALAKLNSCGQCLLGKL